MWPNMFLACEVLLMGSLDGIMPVILEEAEAVPLCTPQLADPGLRVIKVERVGCRRFGAQLRRACE